MEQFLVSELLLEQNLGLVQIKNTAHVGNIDNFFSPQILRNAANIALKDRKTSNNTKINMDLEFKSKNELELPLILSAGVAQLQNAAGRHPAAKEEKPTVHSIPVIRSNGPSTLGSLTISMTHAPS